MLLEYHVTVFDEIHEDVVAWNIGALVIRIWVETHLQHCHFETMTVKITMKI